jgi:hypothetical protein
MPQHINVQGVGVIAFPDDMSDDEITHAIETDILSPASSAKRSLASRGLTPEDVKAGRGVTSQDQFSVDGMTGGEMAMAGARGVAHGLGMPTSIEEAGIPQTGHEAAVRLAEKLADMASFGLYGTTKGAVKDLREGYLPMIGRPVADVSKPARAVAEGRPPTKEENLRAIESGTTLGTIAAAQHPAVGRGLGRVAERIGAAADRSASAGMASVVDPAGTNPLRESMGDVLRNEGIRTSNPRKDFAAAATEQGAPFEASTRGPGGRYAGSKPLTPEQRIWNEVLNAAPEASTTKPVTAGARNRAISEVVMGTAAKVLGVPHSVIAAVLGGSEVLGIARKIMTNPLWKTTSAVVKTGLAKAIQSGSVGDVLTIGARVAGGLALDDEYGHDEAVHAAVSGALEQAQGKPEIARQILAGKKVSYENPDGTEIEVPFHIARAFVNQVEWNVSDGTQRMGQGNAQAGKAQTGRAVRIPGLSAQ